MSVRLRLIVAMCLGPLVLGASSIAKAAPIQYRMTGTIDVQFQVGPLPPGIFQGAPFEAILAYDLATPDNRPNDPQRGLYSTTNVEDNFLLIRAGASEMRSVGNLSFEVGNDRDIDDPMAIDGFPDDSFILGGVPFEGNFEHSSIAILRFRLYDPTRSAFASDELPMYLNPDNFVDPFSLADPFIEVSTFQFDPRVYQFTFHAVVDSITVVPEPTAIGLACSALGMPSVFNSKRRQRASFLHGRRRASV